MSLLAHVRYPSPQSPPQSGTDDANLALKMRGQEHEGFRKAESLTQPFWRASEIPFFYQHITPPPEASYGPERGQGETIGGVARGTLPLERLGGGQGGLQGQRQSFHHSGEQHHYARPDDRPQYFGYDHRQLQYSDPSCGARLRPATPPPEPQPAGQGFAFNSWYAHPPYAASFAPQSSWWPPYYQPQRLTQHHFSVPPSALPQQYPPISQRPLNAAVPTFTPVKQQQQSVPVDSLLKRAGINKHARYPQSDTAPVQARAKRDLRRGGREKTPQKLAELADKKANPDPWARAPIPQRGSEEPEVEAEQRVTPKRTWAEQRRAAKRLHIMQRPSPTPQYMYNAQQEPQDTGVSRPLLVIVDLNGTLLVRSKFHGNNDFTPRPHLDEFLDYLFENHLVMVWSSAKPQNVNKMCERLFTKQQRQKLVGIWARDTLNIPPQHYNEKVQCYKQLSWVWNNAAIHARNPVDGIWSQANTVLIDDSIEKAASEPHNIIELDEFEAKPEQMRMDVLGQVALYLDMLRSQRDVSAFIRKTPFAYDHSPPPKAMQQEKKRDTPLEGP